jgi:hypothetical protein
MIGYYTENTEKLQIERVISTGNPQHGTKRELSSAFLAVCYRSSTPRAMTGAARSHLERE